MGMEIAGVAGATSLNEQQVNYNSTVGAQVHAVEQDAKAREVRSTEEAGDSAKAKAETQSEGTTKTTIEDEGVILFRRYDDDGKMTNEVPPGYKGEV